MTGLQDALLWCQTFLDQCKTGKDAELRLLCEDGHLKVNVFADLGPLMAPTVPKTYFGSQKVGNSRWRRSERRATAKIAADRELNEVAAEEAAKKVAAEEAAKRVAAEKAAKAATLMSEEDHATTSSKVSTSNLCWNCNVTMTAEHQCGIPASVSPPVKVPYSRQTYCSLPVVLKKPVRNLDGSPIWTKMKS